MKKIWTDKEREIMTKMFPDNYTDVVATKLKRSYRSICSQSFLMGLKKSEKFMKMELKKQADRLKVVGMKGRYKKGRVPENKGKPMPKHVYEKAKATMFKKGNEPHNTNYNGHERISKDGYIEIRIKKGKYKLKHRVVWEKQNGKIPKGMIVVFKDRDSKNITINNLELISRHENMERNTIHRFPPELKSTIRLVKKLNKKIYEKQNRRPS